MKKKVKKALIGAIMKWDGIAQGCLKELGASNCPLCHLFEDCLYEINGAVHQGKSCPIAVEVGISDCNSTGYHVIKKYLSRDLISEMDGEHRGATCDRIENFIEFLISLLPKKARRKYEL